MNAYGYCKQCMLFFLIGFAILAMVGCGGGSGSSTSTSGDTTTIPTGYGRITGTVALPPDADASEKSYANVYVAGQYSSSVETDTSGKFSLLVDLSTGGTITKHAMEYKSDSASETSTDQYTLVIRSSSGEYGKSIQVDAPASGQASDLSSITVSKTSSIIGSAALENATDNTGINVYIPGTSFSAMTDATGNYTISGVPEGTYDFLRAEKDGYHYAAISDISVISGATITADNMKLLLSTGASGWLIINDGKGYSTSLTVDLTIAATDDAVLMSIAETSDFLNASWTALKTSTTYTFSSNGLKTLYIKFSDANGLQSNPYSASVYVETNYLVNRSSPSEGKVVNTRPTLQWTGSGISGSTYHMQLSSDINFSSIIEEAAGLASTNYLVKTTLQEWTTYYWRVSIVGPDGAELGWAGPWSFSTSGNFKLPDTGQTTSYTDVFGEDADYTINPPSYTDNGNGTIKDNVTGLLWQKENDGTRTSFTDAKLYCDALSLGGVDDWRLPNDMELLSIVNYGTSDPAIDTAYFIINVNGESTYFFWDSKGGYVSFYAGTSSPINGYYNSYARCVRGGELVRGSLNDNLDDTVTDVGTGLVWQKTDGGSMTWNPALTYCEDLSLGGYADWRLPNIKELASVSSKEFFNLPPTSSSAYWSSTIYTDPLYLLPLTIVIDSSNFHVGANGWGGIGTADIRCMRGGQ